MRIQFWTFYRSCRDTKNDDFISNNWPLITRFLKNGKFLQVLVRSGLLDTPRSAWYANQKILSIENEEFWRIWSKRKILLLTTDDGCDRHGPDTPDGNSILKCHLFILKCHLFILKHHLFILKHHHFILKCLHFILKCLYFRLKCLHFIGNHSKFPAGKCHFPPFPLHVPPFHSNVTQFPSISL